MMFAACASDGHPPQSPQSPQSGQTPPSGHAQHAQASPSASPSATTPARRVPAFFGAPPDVRTLPATLAPERFEGQVRLAYQVAKEIPGTLAQLPCFCYCDTIGHKSLHSCYEDEHSAGCGICLDSALMAYKLDKEGLAPMQIRERLIAKYR
jgi:hypothetical protein